MSVSEQYAVVILAAGESSRMGEAKQLLHINGKTLLSHAVEEAIHAKIGPVVVVLGAFAEQMEEEIADLPVHTTINQSWQQGMGTSIRRGILEIQQLHPSCQGSVIMLSDQPYADAALLNKLIKKHQESQKPVIASTYKNTLGVPAFFHYSFFPLLSKLEGSVGARKLIKRHTDQLANVDFPQGGLDIDTPEDYQKIKEKIEQGKA